jgi:hypothetical protein
MRGNTCSSFRIVGGASVPRHCSATRLPHLHGEARRFCAPASRRVYLFAATFRCFCNERIVASLLGQGNMPNGLSFGIILANFHEKAHSVKANVVAIAAGCPPCAGHPPLRMLPSAVNRL